MLDLVLNKLNNWQGVVSSLVLLGLVQLFCSLKFSFWSRRNVKTPPTWWIFGNVPSLFLRARQEIEIEWPKKYGRVYGYYFGIRPVLVVADAEVLRQICIKDFDLFPNHSDIFGPLNEVEERMILVTKDDHWRNLRAIVSPTFTSSKMRAMHSIFNYSTEIMLEELQSLLDSSGNKSTVADLKHYLHSTSLCSSVGSFYGLKLVPDPAEKKPNSRELWSRKTADMFSPSFWRIAVSFIIPQKILKKFGFSLSPKNKFDFFLQTSKGIIKERRKSGRKQDDYLQLLLDARCDDQPEKEKLDLFNEGTELEYDTASDKKKFLSDKDTLAQSIMMMMVSTETTGTLMLDTCYVLANEPECQDKLYNILNEIQDDELFYENVVNCNYLDCVISEVLRMMTPALFFDRTATEDYRIEKYDIEIPKGTTVFFAYHSIHYDEAYWENPFKFDPSRFSPENKHKIVPGSFTPFGQGPRFCVGYRFGLIETKIVLARLLRKFKLGPAEGVKYPPEGRVPGFLLGEYKDLRVSILAR